MYCFACCTATAYEMAPLNEHFSKKYTTRFEEGVIHVQYKKGDIFFFPYGVIVFWGIEKEDDQHFILEVEPYEILANEEIESDKFNYFISDDTQVKREEIVLPNHSYYTLLAVSHALAQSIKLSIFERTIQKAVRSVGDIPRWLAQNGTIPLSRRQIRKKMGELFIDRSSINLHFDILDTPEFFSEYPDLEAYYQKAATYLELKPRIEVLNQRLDVVHKFFELLSNELNHQHSNRLEWIIILLIMVEVGLTISVDVLHLI